MCKSFGVSLVRWIMVLSNALLFFSSFVIMIRSGVLYGRIKSYENIMDSSLQTLPLIAFLLSLIFCLFTIFGFAGICLNSFGMVCFYVIAVLVWGLILAICGVTLMNESKEISVNQYYYAKKLDNTREIQTDKTKMVAVNNIQRDMLCCGFASGNVYSFYNKSWPLPKSCCKNPNHQCIAMDVWQHSCEENLLAYGIVVFHEQGVMFLSIAGQCLIIGGIGYAFSMALRQYYYY